MAHKGLRQLSADESTSLVYEQAGADIYTTDHNTHATFDWIWIIAGVGTDTLNKYYANIPGNNPHWIGIQNIGSLDDAGAIEEAELQAQSLVGDDLARSGAVSNLHSNDINLSRGDIVYGKFDEIRLRITDGPGHINMIRLIRGV